MIIFCAKLFRLAFTYRGSTSKSEEVSAVPNTRGSSRQEVLPPKANSLKRKSYHFTELQVEAAKLRAQGCTLSQIASTLGRKPHHISHALKSFGQVADCMRKTVFDLKAVHYWEMMCDRNPSSVSGQAILKQMRLAGKWPYGPKQVPYGYVVGEGMNLVLDYDKMEGIRRIFKRVENGEAPAQVARDEGFKHPQPTLYHMLRNPLYKGCVRYAGKTYPSTQEKIVDEDTWENVQRMITSMPRGHTPFGFKRKGPKFVVDDEKTKLIRDVFRLRLERKSCSTIGRELGIKWLLVRNILKNNAYVEIVGSALWNQARNVKISDKERGEQKRSLNQVKVILRLTESPAHVRDIMEATGLSRSGVIKHLRKLRRNGIVDKEPQFRGKYFLRKAS
jgi:DNA-binding MarR family transcriptional regulator